MSIVEHKQIEGNIFDDSEDIQSAVSPNLTTYRMKPRLLSSLSIRGLKPAAPAIPIVQSIQSISSNSLPENSTSPLISSRGFIKNPNFGESKRIVLKTSLRLPLEITKKEGGNNQPTSSRTLPMQLVESIPKRMLPYVNGESCRRNSDLIKSDRSGNISLSSKKVRNFIEYTELRKLQEAIRVKQLHTYSLVVAQTPITNKVEISYGSFKRFSMSVRGSASSAPKSIIKPRTLKLENVQPTKEKTISEKKVLRSRVTFNPNCMVMIYDRDVNYFREGNDHNLKPSWD